MEWKPIVRNTLVQSVVDQLLERIKDGSLAPGERLPSERELMKNLHVGRSTIREALRSLVVLNLVELRPGQGNYIRAMGVESVINTEMLKALMDRNRMADLLEVRKLIEPVGAELAAQRATDADLAGLLAIIEECRQRYAQGKTTAELSARLHVEIIRAAHNGVLVTFMESILDLLTERGEKLEHEQGFAQWELDSHCQIVNAIVARDGKQVHRLMTRHLETSARRLLDALV